MKSTARLRVGVLLVLVVVALVSSLGALLWGNQEWDGLALNFGTEMAGAVMTYLLLELFIGGRERREANKAALIAQMGSSVKDVAVAAAEELGRHGWLYDGSLRGANLERANLQGAVLSGANLEQANLIVANLGGANLHKAHLNGADLSGANLSEAHLGLAHLSGADLSGADLIRAHLSGADLFRADLFRADLIRANLYKADLIRANLEGAALSEYTTLPDGKVDTGHRHGPLHRPQAS